MVDSNTTPLFNFPDSDESFYCCNVAVLSLCAIPDTHVVCLTCLGRQHPIFDCVQFLVLLFFFAIIWPFTFPLPGEQVHSRFHIFLPDVVLILNFIRCIWSSMYMVIICFATCILTASPCSHKNMSCNSWKDLSLIIYLNQILNQSQRPDWRLKSKLRLKDFLELQQMVL